MENNQICSYDCDSCGSKGPTVLLQHEEVPVMSQCLNCSPSAFERAARQDIDRWLATGETSQFGRVAQ